MENEPYEESKSQSRQKRRELGKLTLDIDGDALRDVIASGRLLELADTVATEAAAQISAQIVESVAEAALSGGLQGASAGVAFIFDGGDFGTVPPRPKRGIFQHDLVSRLALRRVANEFEG
jgi:hypothetical protein